MKVVFNTYPVAFQCPGGGEIQLLKSIEALQDAGVQVIKYNPWSTDLAEADVVHYFSVQGGSMNFCNYVHTAGIPLVISPIIWLGDNPEIYPVQEISQLLNIADIICPNSYAEQDQLASYFNIPQGNFIVTHNGIDEIFREHVDAQLFRDEYKIYDSFILCVANIEPRKNQLNLIKAAKSIKKKLILIGNIRDSTYFDACMKEADDRTQYLGFIEHHDRLLRSAYAACDVFALPSALETPGLAAMEAAACNARIVITSVGATQEYFGKIATYVSPEEPDDIAAGLTSALQIPDSATNNTKQMSNYSWRRTGEELILAYKNAIVVN